MRVYLLAMVISLLCGCATNRLHFARYTTTEQLSIITSTPRAARIDAVTGIDRCTACLESDKIVWHAANFSDGRFYEGFAPIPVSDWEAFVRDALQGSEPGTSKGVQIEIRRIFLKTWPEPQYIACEVVLSVHANGKTRTGTGVVKIAGAGQHLRSPTVATLDPAALEAIRLGLVSAYADAGK